MVWLIWVISQPRRPARFERILQGCRIQNNYHNTHSTVFHYKYNIIWSQPCNESTMNLLCLLLLFKMKALCPDAWSILINVFYRSFIRNKQSKTCAYLPNVLRGNSPKNIIFCCHEFCVMRLTHITQVTSDSIWSILLPLLASLKTT